MADKTTGGIPAVQESPIGGLPGILDLYDDSLIPVEQQGEARHMTGLQWRQYAQNGVSQYVEGARNAAQASEAAAKLAAESAVTAEQYSGKPPVIADGEWQIWNADEQEYESTGTPATGPQGVRGDAGSSIKKVERTAGNGAAGTVDEYTVTMTDGVTFTFSVYNGADGTGAGDMVKSVYDPQNKARDIFQYVDDTIARAIPPGGTAGQMLVKASDKDYDGQWVDPVTMAQVNGAIEAAITGAIEEVYYGTRGAETTV